MRTSKPKVTSIGYAMNRDDKGSTDQLDKKHNLILLIMEMFSQIDEIASLKKNGSSANLSQYLLKETCSILPELDKETSEIYLDLLVKIGSKRDTMTDISVDEQYVSSISDKRLAFVQTLKAQLAA